MRTLWIVSGGMEAVPGIQRARQMGLHVVVSDGNPKAPGFAHASDSIIASTYDVEATVQAATDYHRRVRPIDGVICIASDVPLTVATVAQELGLPGIPISTAQLASNKMAMKDRFVQSGIPVPWYSRVGSLEELHQIIRRVGLPLVLKPVDSRGARGVLRLTEHLDLEWAFNHSLAQSPSRQVMVEEYLFGPQISTESVLVVGWTATPGFSDRNYELLDRFAPYVIENGGNQPSVLDDDERRAVSILAEKAGRALGITNGIVKGDMVLTPQGPKVIEIATRLSGGWFCTDQIPLATEVDLVGAAIRLALGEQVRQEEVTPKAARGVAIRYFFPEPGRVESIRNVERFDGVPWIHRLKILVSPGEMVNRASDHTKRVGFVITTGKDREEAMTRAQEVVGTIEIITERESAPCH